MTTPANSEELQLHKYADEWKLADKDGSGKLNFKEVERLLAKLNLGLKDADLKARIKKIDKDGNKELDFHEFCEFLDDLHVRPEFKSIYEQYSKGKDFLAPEGFLAFLQDQGEKDATLDTAKTLMAKHEPNIAQFSFQSFTSYMTSPENALYSYEHTSKVYQPMNLPLSNYLIASSHNTYAEAHQLVGVASAEAYINALKRGCKCLELDVWDGDDNMPIITHGHTLLTKLKFRDAIVAIRDYAFVVSPYPVILSFENHCSEKQQIRMAEILIEVLGAAGMLPNHLFDKVFPLPTPDQLKNKVLVKGKVISPFVPGEVIDTQKKTKKPAIVVAKELSDLVHLKATKFAGFPHDHKNKVYEMFSISEQKTESYFAKEFNNLVKLTATQCAKVYPKGTRFGSSNYSPVVGWSTGCQMVCLNYQTHDEPMWLNIGRFLDNGGSGYVLKPQSLLSDNPVLSKKTLTLTLISGWSLPKETGTQQGSIINPYVNIKTFGVAEDTKKFKSKIVHLDGFNPSWNETFTIDFARPELAMILFKVYEHDTKGKNDFLGYSAIPITSLKSGYRNVQLFDAKSVPYPEASLFVKVVVA